MIRLRFSLLSNIILVMALSLAVVVVNTLFQNSIALHERNKKLFQAYRVINNHANELYGDSTSEWRALTPRQILDAPRVTCSYLGEPTVYGTTRLTLTCVIEVPGNVTKEVVIEKRDE